MIRLIVGKAIWHLGPTGGCRKPTWWLSETDWMVVGNRSDGCQKSKLMIIGCPSGGYQKLD